MKGLKNLSLFIAILLIFSALLIILTFFGNPISRIIANIAANKYLKTHYTEFDLERDHVYYNFKDGTYVVRLQDKNSIDTNFNLSFDSIGRMKHDTYGNRLFNTFRRYMYFLDDLGEEIATDNGLDFELWLRPDDDFDYRLYLTLDQEFDAKELPSMVTAGFKAYAEKPSLEDLMNGLKKVYEVLKERNIAVNTYSGLVIPNEDKEEEDKAETWKNSVSVHDVPKKVIIDEDMKELKRIYDQGNKILYK